MAEAEQGIILIFVFSFPLFCCRRIGICSRRIYCLCMKVGVIYKNPNYLGYVQNPIAFY